MTMTWSHIQGKFPQDVSHTNFFISYMFFLICLDVDYQMGRQYGYVRNTGSQ